MRAHISNWSARIIPPLWATFAACQSPSPAAPGLTAALADSAPPPATNVEPPNRIFVYSDDDFLAKGRSGYQDGLAHLSFAPASQAATLSLEPFIPLPGSGPLVTANIAARLIKPFEFAYYIGYKFGKTRATAAETDKAILSNASICHSAIQFGLTVTGLTNTTSGGQHQATPPISAMLRSDLHMIDVPAVSVDATAVLLTREEQLLSFNVSTKLPSNAKSVSLVVSLGAATIFSDGGTDSSTSVLTFPL